MIKAILSKINRTLDKSKASKSGVSFHGNLGNSRLSVDLIMKDWIEILQNEPPLEGHRIQQFESVIGDYLKQPFCVAVGSGSDALTIALRSLKLSPGSVVLVPGFSFISTGICILENQLEPCFLDIDPTTGLTSCDQILAGIERFSPRAILIPHLNGNLVDLRKIYPLAKQKKIWLIEDAAQSFGSTIAGEPPGRWSDIVCLSFDPQKILGSFGSAGAILTSHEVLAKNAQQIRKYGSATEVDFPWLGVNSRLASLQASFLLRKLPLVSDEIKKRKIIRAQYREGLAGLGNVVLLKDPPDCDPNGYRFILKTEKRDQLRKVLLEQNIETRIHYPYCLYHQQPFQKFAQAILPGCEMLAAHNLSLPCHGELGGSDLERIVKAIQEFSRYN
jgi:dTDP-4-amino-4,6-dideoxygalactose transaminase